MDELVERIRTECPERCIPAPRSVEYDGDNQAEMVWLGVSLVVRKKNDVLEVANPQGDIVTVINSDEVEEGDISAVFPYLWERVAYHCSRPIAIPQSHPRRRRKVRKTV